MAIKNDVPTAEPIYSEFRADPDFRELVELFVSEMPNRKVQLERAYLCWDVAQLRTQAHQLKGSAGGYGFGGLSQVAATLEAACSKQDPAEVAEHLRMTLNYLSRICV